MKSIDRRTFLGAVGAGAALALWPMSASAQNAPAAAAAGGGAPRRPNVLIVLSDDQGYADFSCHGHPFLKTPNLDRLHSQSVRLTDFHVSPMCTPTRGQLLTGMDALHNGACSVTAGRSFIRPGIPTAAEMFASGGYRTGLFGKWHLGESYPNRPMDKGFQRAYYMVGWGIGSAAQFWNNTLQDMWILDQGVKKQSKGYCTDVWFEQAMAWMKDRHAAGEPFFCYLPTNAPHGPCLAPEKYTAPYEGKGAAGFFGMIANLDENMGKLEAFLQETGLADNTIVIFMNDNGGTAGVRAYNAGMRGGKTGYYDGGHRAACFIRWPAGGLRPGDIAYTSQIQDLLPTLLEFCGVAKPANAAFDGASLAGLLKGTVANPPDRMFVVQYGQTPKKWDAAVLWNQWRLVHGEELYDIKADLAQKNDLASKHPDVVAKLKAHYEKWWAEVEPKIKDFVPIVIGAAQENPVELTCVDWADVYCDNQGHLRNGAGGPKGGPWHVQVAQDGTYEFELRRWPRAAEAALDAGVPEFRGVLGRWEAGRALPVAAVKMTIAGQEFSQEAPSGTKSVTFKADLKAGRTQMQAWFCRKDGTPVSGAFFAYVRRL